MQVIVAQEFQIVFFFASEKTSHRFELRTMVTRKLLLIFGMSVQKKTFSCFSKNHFVFIHLFNCTDMLKRLLIILYVYTWYTRLKRVYFPYIHVLISIFLLPFKVATKWAKFLSPFMVFSILFKFQIYVAQSIFIVKKRLPSDTHKSKYFPILNAYL